MKASIKKFTILFLFCLTQNSIAQNIAITDSNSYNPNNSAMLDIQSNSKGMLVPRLTTSQRTTINNPALGLLVFDTDFQNFFYYNGNK